MPRLSALTCRPKRNTILGGWLVGIELESFNDRFTPFSAYSDVDGINFTEEEMVDTIETLQNLLAEWREINRTYIKDMK